MRVGDKEGDIGLWWRSRGIYNTSDRGIEGERARASDKESWSES